MERTELVRELEQTLASSNLVMRNISRDAAKAGRQPHEMMNRDGTYAMAPVLHTRAMVLSSLTALYTA